MRTLVTGGSGYFGEVVVQRLLERGDSVRVFDLVDNEDRPAHVELVRGDVRDRDAVRRALEGVEVVHHNVAQVPLAKNRHEFWSVNVDGTRLVLDEALRAGVRKVVLVSSSAVYGVPDQNPVTLATPPRPREAYGAAKLEGETYAKTVIDKGLSVSIVRPRTILGHGRLGIFQILFEWVRRSRPVYLLGQGHNRYQFVHADDLAAACLLADQRKQSDVLLCGTDRFGTMRELLEGLVAHAGSRSPVRSLPFRPTVVAMKVTSKLGVSPLGDYHSLMYGREMYFDIQSTQDALGWKPKFSNAEMIADSYDWYVAHREEVLTREGASHHRSPVKLGVLKLLERLP
ncbi:MAG: NAD-dependent epimerase/dehydratase family protein [Polyangiaceae bacterium]|nr:NAD-dependent epimerase/dehydratase family protein [Polyangiaceae bacterium]MCL4752874.1 NAD-dependent epimerase/dehydratase family protein [Myxococcales bacterium]